MARCGRLRVRAAGCFIAVADCSIQFAPRTLIFYAAALPDNVVVPGSTSCSPNVVRWRAAAFSSRDESVAELVDAGNVQPSTVTDQDSGIPADPEPDGRLKLVVPVQIRPDSSRFSSRGLAVLSFLPGGVRRGRFVARAQEMKR